MQPTRAEAEQALEQIRGLLFASERRQIEELRPHLLDEPTRVEDVAEVLPQAVLAGHAQGKKLSLALQAPVTICLQSAVREEPQPVVDALFPIIGPAIRKAIAEAMREMTESINQTIENSFSAKGLKWRIEAARSGVPFSEVVLKHTLRYRVDEVFLIHRATGLLVGHAAQADIAGRDNDAISGMLTAIQDFVQDAFSAQNPLQEVTLGENLLWILHGPDAMLVCVIRGAPSGEARTLLAESLERIQRDFRKPLMNFSGDTAGFPGLKTELRECLVKERMSAGDAPLAPPPPVVKKRGPSLTQIFSLLALIGFAVLGFWLWSSHQERTRVDTFVAELRARPGIIVDDVRKQDGHWQIRGLRDPLALETPRLPEGLDPQQLSFSWTPYLSLDPMMIERRVRLQLRSPESVGLYVEDGVLFLNGEAPKAWVDSVRAAAFLPAGVSQIDMSRLIAR